MLTDMRIWGGIHVLPVAYSIVLLHIGQEEQRDGSHSIVCI